ncbi:PIG-L family deacetylase [Actinocorallia longicatena]|uniref:PIG-L family deacetylase n=1 Tax=Actinocorallia longicatena TaxID=111803 RepID=A0ABP6Q9K1_9ACTN
MQTLMAVHAHPDDEVLGTGGVLAKAAAAGIRTVLVTCTNGEQGDGPGGVKPGEEGHDPHAVRETRLAELAESAKILGIEHVELLGHQDSGMDGWDANHAEHSFANVDFDSAVAQVEKLMEHYRPQVVVTYDDNGGYGHPDHIQAHRVAVAATERTGIPQKLYYTAIPKSGIREMFEYVKANEIEVDWMADATEPPDFGTPDEIITTVTDVSEHVTQKINALRAHASQGENIFFLRLPDEAVSMMMGKEAFVRVRGEGPENEDDLFAGLA